MNCALITGASRGIGKAIAKTISKDLGLHILINYSSNTKAAEETLAEIVAAGGTGELLKFNVQDEEQVKNSLLPWMENNKEKIIEVLVNNAGITRDGLFLIMEKEDWKNVLDISLDGFYNVTQPIIKKMSRKRYGRIVNIVSVSGQKGTPGQVNYSAAKGGLIGATKALGQEMAKRKITVNAVAPGFIESDMTKDLDEDILKKMIPMNRFGKVQEVADLVSFLASPKASYITGEIININGGIYS
tara:strand:+ start:6198 stop:6929 length:732 start_codon:yes stop_codon:yes gene_type:complete